MVKSSKEVRLPLSEEDLGVGALESSPKDRTGSMHDDNTVLDLFLPSICCIPFQLYPILEYFRWSLSLPRIEKGVIKIIKVSHPAPRISHEHACMKYSYLYIR
ncbi:hypothetical protein EYC84_003415 [Monilinia fructicola]|uniref:Uncharacterized protein n=1 Tax=Monilinia fructicola TaxID=38448 RepID=A0A5M9K1R1_MONFR|nr:hypothetical protein EYC84_003415 [Monilinia fructicola]